jgi:hypothetical protein
MKHVAMGGSASRMLPSNSALNDSLLTISLDVFFSPLDQGR